MRLSLGFLVFIMACSTIKEQEFEQINNFQDDYFDQIENTRIYVPSSKKEYINFSNKGEAYTILKELAFKADEFHFITEPSTLIFGDKYNCSSFQISFKTQIIESKSIAKVTYTNRTLKLNISLIDDKTGLIKDSILNRIKSVSIKNQETDYYAPWLIEMNYKGIFQKDEKYIFWEYYYNKKEAYYLYYFDDKCLKLELAPEPNRFNEKHFKKWKKKREKEIEVAMLEWEEDKISREEFIDFLEEMHFTASKVDYLRMINKLDYRGLQQYGQGCSSFISKKTGGIQWQNKDCKIPFECEFNLESKEILNLIENNIL